MRHTLIIAAGVLAAVWTGRVEGGTGTGPTLAIGWAQADITPAEPVFIAGQNYARISEGVQDPVTVTALAFESVRDGATASMVWVSCDLISVHPVLRDAVREQVRQADVGLDPMAIAISATHSHSSPMVSHHTRAERVYGMAADVMAPAAYREFAAQRIAETVIAAWRGRAPGSIAYGLGHAVVGRNRLTAYRDGTSRMFGSMNDPEFSHMEGREDPSVHLLAIYDMDGALTGLVVNLACPAQVSSRSTTVSADFWHETREELRRRFGSDLFVLAQAGPSGDQSPHLHGNECRNPESSAAGENPEARMWRLAGRTQREEIGVRIADAVSAVLPWIREERNENPVLVHRVETLDLPRRRFLESDLESARAAIVEYRAAYDRLQSAREQNPELQDDPQWIREISRTRRMRGRNEYLLVKAQRAQNDPFFQVELHVARLGDVAWASNPFELYVDYGTQIRAQSRAAQTFLVQLAGPGSYAPTEQAVSGGAYGSRPVVTEIGPDGARLLVEWTVAAIAAFWE